MTGSSLDLRTVIVSGGRKAKTDARATVCSTCHVRLYLVVFHIIWTDPERNVVRPAVLFRKISVDARRTWSAVMTVASPFAVAISSALAKWFTFRNIPPDPCLMAVFASSPKISFLFARARLSRIYCSMSPLATGSIWLLAAPLDVRGVEVCRILPSLSAEDRGRICGQLQPRFFARLRRL